MTTLFPETPALSPRLAWMARHGLSFFASDDGRTGVRNCAHTRLGLSDDEPGALIDYAERHGIKHWQQEEVEALLSGSEEF